MRILLGALCTLALTSQTYAYSIVELLAYHGALTDATVQVSKWYEQGLNMRPILFTITKTHEGRVCTVARNVTYLVDRSDQKHMIRASYVYKDIGCTGKVTSAAVTFKSRRSAYVLAELHNNKQAIYDADIEAITQIEHFEYVSSIAKTAGFRKWQ